MAQIPVKKVLLFGRTGDGKSTLANMLVSGNLDNPRFKIGDGMLGVTGNCEAREGRNYEVVDTVGLGEETGAESQNPTDLIYNFLKETRGEYSHILFVKAAGRLDKLDKEIWRIFLKVFKDADPAFGVIVTKCPNGNRWGAQNKDTLEKTYKECQSRFVFVDFPPVNNRSEMETELSIARQESLQRLDAALDGYFETNNFQYYKPSYTSLDEPSLRQRAKEVFNFILDIARKFTGIDLKTILGLFAPPGATLALELFNRILQNIGGGS